MGTEKATETASSGATAEKMQNLMQTAGLVFSSFGFQGRAGPTPFQQKYHAVRAAAASTVIAVCDHAF